MLKPFLTVIFILCFLLLVNAQKQTAMFFFKNTVNGVAVKDSDGTYQIKIPASTDTGATSNDIRMYYLDNSISFIAPTANTKFNAKDCTGSLVYYFANGNKKRIIYFENGQPVGDVTEFYPNGNVYNIRSNTTNSDIYFKECRDSTGKVLAENGYGFWIIMDDAFKKIQYSTKVYNGFPGDSATAANHHRFNLKYSVESEQLNGKLIEKRIFYKEGDKLVPLPDVSEGTRNNPPAFPGGSTAFFAFLDKNIIYPLPAVNDRTEGVVFVAFVVRNDGSVDNIKVIKGIGNGCDEEAIRVVKSCQNWQPGYHQGIPSTTALMVPVVFRIKKRNE